MNGGDFEIFVGSDKRRMPLPRGMATFVFIIAVVLAGGMIIVHPGDSAKANIEFLGYAEEMVRATVVEASTAPCSYAPEMECRLVSFDVSTSTDGESLVERFDYEAGGDEIRPPLRAGEEVFLSVTVDAEENTLYQYYDRDRIDLLGLVLFAFALFVIGLGRKRGLAALVGLALSLLVLFFFILPAIIAGKDAMLVALIGGGALALLALYLAHGYSPLTHVAAVGAIAALALTVGLSWVTVELAHFSGLTSEEAFYLLDLPGINLQGLLLAGIVLGAIGALDDVTVTQASAVTEIYEANPSLSAKQLYESGIRVGRAHIGSMVNTLLLAYAGVSLPLMVLLSLSSLPLLVIASSEVVALEIIRTLVGSIGLIAAVPITTWLAAREAVKSPPVALPPIG